MNGVDARLDGDPHDVVDVEVGVDRTLALADEIALVRLGPMQREAVLAEWIATVRIPSSVAARITRMAISPRFAMRRLPIAAGFSNGSMGE